MKGWVAVLIVLVTAVGCAAVTHLLDRELDKQKQAIQALHTELKARESTPEYLRLRELEERAARLEAGQTFLRETSQQNAGLVLILAALDGLGTDLRAIQYGDSEVRIEVSQNPDSALQRLQAIPAASHWTRLDGNAFGGRYLP